MLPADRRTSPLRTSAHPGVASWLIVATRCSNGPGGPVPSTSRVRHPGPGGRSAGGSTRATRPRVDRRTGVRARWERLGRRWARRAPVDPSCRRSSTGAPPSARPRPSRPARPTVRRTRSAGGLRRPVGPRSPGRWSRPGLSWHQAEVDRSLLRATHEERSDGDQTLGWSVQLVGAHAHSRTRRVAGARPRSGRRAPGRVRRRPGWGPPGARTTSERRERRARGRVPSRGNREAAPMSHAAGPAPDSSQSMSSTTVAPVGATSTFEPRMSPWQNTLGSSTMAEASEASASPSSGRCIRRSTSRAPPLTSSISMPARDAAAGPAAFAPPVEERDPLGVNEQTSSSPPASSTAGTANLRSAVSSRSSASGLPLGWR